MTPRGRILVTPRSVTRDGHPSLDRLRAAGYEVVFAPAGRQPTEDELIAGLQGCVGLLAGVEPITRRAIDSSPTLRVISRNGTGVDKIDAAAAHSHGIVIRRADGANARGVAELTLAFMLALARDLPNSSHDLKQGGWNRRQGFELEGKTLGLVGFGRVGRLVAGFGKMLGLRVLAHDPVIAPGDPSLAGVHPVGLGELLRSSDILSLHCPPPTDGSPLLDAESLRHAKRGIIIVNTARFDLIDLAAMLKALQDGHVAGLALDVFAEEPPADLTLIAHPRVLVTPHVGGFTRESIDRAMEAAVENLLHELARTVPPR